MSNIVTIEYRIPVGLDLDGQVQDLARRLAKQRGQRRVPIRQVVREALVAFLASHLASPDQIQSIPTPRS